MFEGDIKLNQAQTVALQVRNELKNWAIVGKRSGPTLGIDTNLTNSLPDIPIKYWRLPVPIRFAQEISGNVPCVINASAKNTCCNTECQGFVS